MSDYAKIAFITLNDSGINNELKIDLPNYTINYVSNYEQILDADFINQHLLIVIKTANYNTILEKLTANIPISTAILLITSLAVVKQIDVNNRILIDFTENEQNTDELLYKINKLINVQTHFTSIKKSEKEVDSISEVDKSINQYVNHSINQQKEVAEIIINNSGKVHFVNQAFELLTGIKSTEIIDNYHTLFSIIHPNDISKIRNYLSEPAKSKNIDNIVFRIVNKYNEIKYILFSLNHYFTKTKEYIGCIIQFKDITAVYIKYESSFKFEYIAENLNIAIVICSSDGIIEYVNKNFTELSGFNAIKICGKNIAILYPENNKILNLNTLHENKTSIEIWISKLRNINNNNYIDVKNTLKPIFNNYREVSSYLIIIDDITREVKSAEALEKSQELYKFLTENSNDMVWAMDSQLNYTYISPTAYRMFGYTPDEYFNMEKSRILTQESVVTLMMLTLDLDTQYFETRQPHIQAQCELEAMHKNQSKIWIEVTIKILVSHDGQIAGYYGNTRDITNRKKSEIALKQSEEQFKEFYNTVPIGLYTATTDGMILMANKTMLEILQYNTLAELQYQSAQTGLYVSITEKQKVLNRLRMHEEVRNMESRWRRSDGSFIFVNENIKLVHDNKLDLDLYKGSVEDITTKLTAIQQLEKNERKLKEAQEIAKLGSWEIDHITNTFFGSDGLYTILEINKPYSVSDFSVFISYIHPDDKAFVNDEFAKSLTQKNDFSFTYRIFLKNKIIKHINQKCYTIFNENKFPLRTIGIVLDITEQIRAQAILRESEENYRLLVENTDDGIALINLGFSVLFKNHYYYKILGFKSANDYKNNPNADIENILFAKLKTGIKGFMQNKRTEYDVKITNNQHQDVYLHVKAIVIKKDNHKSDSILIIIRDITQNKIYEDEIIRAKEKAELANTTKSAFLANVSHEIRTPMNAVIGFTDLLSKYISDTQGLNYLNAIKTSGQTLLELINDILDLSKIEAGKMELKPTATFLPTVINEIRDIFQYKVLEKGLVFTSHIHNPLNCYYLIDELRLRQILINLVNNAVKFTSKGNITLDLEIFDNPETNTKILTITVTDTGIGIKPESIPVIFDAFNQTSDLDSRKYGGTGLGLAITKRLLELMHGTITVNSVPGKGSSFVINIPVNETTVKIETDDEQLFNYKKYFFERKKILIADDNYNNRKLLIGYLNENDFEISEAETGNEAIKIAQQFKPDLILMDIRMPDTDGFKASQLIRKQKNSKTVPIIAITASAFEINKFLNQTPFNSILIKPVSISTFYRTLSKYLPFSIKNMQIPEPEKVNQDNIPEHLANNLIGLLENNLKNDLIRISQSPDLTDAEHFGFNLKKTGELYSYKPLIVYGTHLMQAASEFAPDKVEILLNSYYNLITDLKAKLKTL